MVDVVQQVYVRGCEDKTYAQASLDLKYTHMPVAMVVQSPLTICCLFLWLPVRAYSAVDRNAFNHELILSHVVDVTNEPKFIMAVNRE